MTLHVNGQDQTLLVGASGPLRNFAILGTSEACCEALPAIATSRG